MATGSLTDSPWLFEKLSGRLGLQASKTQGRLPLVGYLTGRLPEGDPTSKNLLEDNHTRDDTKKPAISRQTPNSVVPN